MWGLVDPNLDQYKVFETKFEGGFRDYFFQLVLHGDDGNDYFLVYTLARMVKYDICQLNIVKEPLWYFTTPTTKVIQKGEKPEISLGGTKPIGALKTVATPTSFTAELDDFKVICTPPTYQILYTGKEMQLDLKLSNLGTPFWFGQGKEQGAQITPSNIVWGMEMYGNVEGSMTVAGKKINLTGVGIHEHIVGPSMSWVEYVWQDWIWFHFDEMYGMIFELQGGGFKDGGIYLMQEKEYAIIKDFDIDHPKWAYSTFLQHNVPIEIIARATTDKGTLILNGTAQRSFPWRKITKNRPGFTMPSADMQYAWSGTFTYNDGRTIELKNGRGADEVIGTYNFVQSYL